MNKPERLPPPDFSHWLPASLRDHADDQKAIPRIAKDAALIREIEAALPALQTTHDLKSKEPGSDIQDMLRDPSVFRAPAG